MARVKQQREASCRYGQSPEGRFNHRLNQRAYRHRLAQARRVKDSVTDQGSARAVIVAISVRPTVAQRRSSAFRLLALPIAVPWAMKIQPLCRRCGRQGYFVDT